MTRGKLIVFEGCDRSGKSSQCQRQFAKLSERIKCKKLIFPGILLFKTADRTTIIGQMINQYLQGSCELDDHVIHLLFSANRWEVAKNIEKLLNEGITLIVDRYLYSGIAFSAAKGLDFDWCASPDAGLPKADIVIFLDIAPEVAALRGDYGNERYERLDFQKRVYESYLKLEDESWFKIDASQSMDKVEADIDAVITKHLASSCSQEIEKFEVKK